MSAWYRAGTVTVTNGSVNVVGVDTLWLSQATAGDAFSIDGDKLYEIDSITDNTHLTLQASYTGATASGASYGIIRNFTGTTQAELAASLAALLNSWQTREDQYRNWQAGTITGGTAGDGAYPITDILGNTYNYFSPAKLDKLASGLFGHKTTTTVGLTLGYFGGVMLVDGVITTIADGTLALSASSTNYIEATRAGVVSKNTTGFTAGSIPIREVVTGASSITSITERLPRDVPITGRLSKSVAGGVDVTLTAAEARNQVMEFTGALTGNISVIVPAVAGVFVVGNSTSGSYTLTVKTSAGTGIAVTRGKNALLLCDGTNVVNADTDFAIDGLATLTDTQTLTNKTLAEALATAALADGTNTLALADAQFVQSQIVSSVNSLLPAQGIAFAAATGLTYGQAGTFCLSNAQHMFGTGDFAVVWWGSVPDWMPAANAVLFGKSNGGAVGYALNLIATTGVLRLRLGSSVYDATVAPTLVDGTDHVLIVSVDQTALTLTFYVDGIQLGNAVAFTGPFDTSASNTQNLQISGQTTNRYTSSCHGVYLLNMKLSAADAALIARTKSIPFTDTRGSTTGQTSGTILSGYRYRITTFVAGDDFTNVGAASNATGVEFVATGTTPTTWTNGSTLNPIGATLMLEPEGIQPATGQWFDSSIHKQHAMQPASGVTTVRRQDRFEVRWVNTWAGTHEAQYVGGTNKAVLPTSNIRVESITMRCSATGVNVILGDGSDASRWVASVALAAYLDCTVANRNHDGTNLKLVIDPSANYTGSITTTIAGRIID